MKKIILLLVLAFSLVLTACVSTSNTFDFIIDESFDGFITLGTSADYPPYEWLKEVDGKQQVVGIDIEIAKEIAKSLKKNLKVVNKGFDFLLEDLTSGKVDFVISGMNPTPERLLKVDFSINYYSAVQVVLVKESDLEKYNSFDALNVDTAIVGAQLGSIQQGLAETFKNANKQIIQLVPDLVSRLSDGKIDAVILEKPVAEGFAARIEGLAIANFAIGDPEDGTAVAVRKGSKDLLDSINAVLTDLIESGRIDEIVEEMILLNV